MREDIQSFLASVQKPGRYTGGEPGSVFKDKSAVDLRVAFCFPDTYEIGMSNLGMRILCGCLNAMERVWCERVYAPWTDMEAEMRKRAIPLFTHESGDPLTEFQMVAFTLQYELCYTTMLNMLDLAGIPPLAAERGEDFPVILAGGPCAYNPEPLADFVDIFSIGEGEEALPELAALYLRMKDEGTYTKKAFLYAAATELTGFYVPSLYRVDYHPDGTIRAITPTDDKVPKKVTKRLIADLDACYVPTNPVMPLVETIHDRVTLEVFRGCIRGCRFCQAGMTSRPVREKSPETLNGQAREMVCNSGYSEISLSSLSISDYSKISALTSALLQWTDEKKVNLSLPSMRADSFTKELMDKISSVRTSTLTFAPEAGSQRLRDVINKNITEEEILRAVRVAYAAGKSQVKLYFMNGLPGEREEDIAGIASLASHVIEEYYKTPERNKRQQPQVTLSVACFIPKPHTPFQWERQNTFEELEEKQRYLSSKITDRRIRYHYHDAKVSFLEAVFARGDRRLSAALLEAMRRHVRFDAWEECFDYENWRDIFRVSGVDPTFYAYRTIPDEEILPWDMIDCGVTKEFLLRERHKAASGVPTPSCREQCSGCGVNRLVDKAYCRWCPGHPESEDSAGRITVGRVTVGRVTVGRVTAEETQAPSARPNPSTPSEGVEEGKTANQRERKKPVREVRIRFRKWGPMLYISHLDLSKVMTRAIIRSGLPVYYTEGYNPIPKLVYATPLSVGCGGEREILDIRLMEAVGNVAIRDALRAVMPVGIEIREVYTPKNPLKEIAFAKNEITYFGCTVTEETARAIEEMFRSPVTLMKRSKSGEKETDITALIRSLRAEAADGQLRIVAVTSADSANYLNPAYIAQAVEDRFGVAGERGFFVIDRKKLLLSDGETEVV